MHCPHNFGFRACTVGLQSLTTMQCTCLELGPGTCLELGSGTCLELGPGTCLELGSGAWHLSGAGAYLHVPALQLAASSVWWWWWVAVWQLNHAQLHTNACWVCVVYNCEGSHIPCPGHSEAVLASASGTSQQLNVQ